MRVKLQRKENILALTWRFILSEISTYFPHNLLVSRRLLLRRLWLSVPRFSSSKIACFMNLFSCVLASLPSHGNGCFVFPSFDLMSLLLLHHEAHILYVCPAVWAHCLALSQLETCFSGDLCLWRWRDPIWLYLFYVITNQLLSNRFPFLGT